MTDRIYNFSAGPAILPEPVLKAAQAAVWNFEDSGVGILEHSHRGAEFTKTIQGAVENIRKLAGVPDSYEVLFLQGGASSQFFTVPMSFLSEGQTADYINTGAWSKKAIKEAQRFGAVHIAASSEDENFSYIPEKLSYSERPRYVHFTSNNTIAGTQWASEPVAPSAAPLVCDASSDIFCRPIDVEKYGIIYAGAQKNLGPSGVTLVIIRKSLVEEATSDLPTMLQYRTHAEKDSCFNTPPTFGIYIIGEVVKWLLDRGGLEKVAAENDAKAGKLYDYLDNSKLFKSAVRPGSRSLMNVTFRGANEDMEKSFIAEAGKAGLAGLKGHRSVGGMRASIYNAFPSAGVDKLLAFMEEFENKHQ